MVELGIEQGLPTVIPDHLRGSVEKVEEKETHDEIFFTESPEPEILVRSRLWIARYSLPRTQKRLETQQRRQQALRERAKRPHQIGQNDLESDPSLKLLFGEVTQKRKLFCDLSQFTVCSSSVADRRPLSSAVLSPDGRSVLTAGWIGKCNLWDASSCSLLSSFDAHSDRCTHAVFHPSVSTSTNVSSSSSSSDSDASDTIGFASCGAEGLIKLWALDRSGIIANKQKKKKTTTRRSKD